MNKEFLLYTVKKGDTLSSISLNFYETNEFIDKLVEFNNLENKDSINEGQQLEIPGIDQILEARIEFKNETNPTTFFDSEIAGFNNSYKKPSIIIPKYINNIELLKVPHGINEVIETFGNPKKYLTNSGDISPRWQIDNLTLITLPFPIKKVSRITCHKKLNKIFYSVFEEIDKAGLKQEVKSFGGTYNYRLKRRGSSSLSTHSWGIAIDLNTLTNGMGTKGDMHPGIVKIFKKYGFSWGGDWAGRGCDPMHFQYCTGY